jgi:hypothetical protein
MIEIYALNDHCYGYVKKLEKFIKFNSKFQILVIRILPDNTLSLSHPCSQCVDELKKSKFKQVIYSLNNLLCQITHSKDLTNHHISSSQRRLQA